MELVSIKSKDKKRIGRGLSAGQGKTAGRGTKGQKSRSGHNIPKRHEGGQTPLSMRLPKLPGFKSQKPKAVIVTLDDISKNYKDGETVSLETLATKGIISKNSNKVKILNDGTLTVKVIIGSDLFSSESVRALIENFKPAKTEKTEAQEEPKAAETREEKTTPAKPAAKKTTAKKAEK